MKATVTTGTKSRERGRRTRRCIRLNIATADGVVQACATLTVAAARRLSDELHDAADQLEHAARTGEETEQ